jgi:hypothetical protein
MRKLCPLFVVICVLYLSTLGSCAAWAESKRGVTPEDYLSFKFVGDPHISPDGKIVAYVLTTIKRKISANRRCGLCLLTVRRHRGD